MGRGFFVKTSTSPFDISIDEGILTSQGVCDEQNATYVAAFCESYLALLGDSPLSRTSGDKPRGPFKNFRKELLSRPIRDTVKKYSSLFDLVCSNTYGTGTETITGPFHQEFLDTPVFREYHYWWKTGDPEVLKYLLTFLRFGKKIKYVDEELYATAFRGWLEVEEKLSGLVLDDNVTDDLRAIVHAVLPPLKKSSKFPKFGPGAVSERGVRGPVIKAHHLDFDPGIDRAFFHTSVCGETALPDPDKIIPDPTRWGYSSDHTRNVAALRFVDNDVTKARSIAMEPNTVMYFQQVVHDWLRESIRDGLLGDFIFLEDQTENQRAATHGSVYMSVDTIDLSAASDSVSIDLVERIFPREYLLYLLSTRTPEMDTPQGVCLPVRKFAPMGSACCFPVQCIVFAAVIIHSMMQHDRGLPPGSSLGIKVSDVGKFLRKRVYKRYSEKTPYTWAYESFRVFGDDLVVDSRVYEHVTSLLSSLGFSVNDKKSFSGSQLLRESCGIFAWAGEDVTPLTYKVQHFTAGVINPSAIASLIDAANAAGDRGLRNLRRRLLMLVLYGRIETKAYTTPRHYTRKNPFPFTSDRTKFGLFSTDVRNDHLRYRNGGRYQREEHRGLRIVVTETWDAHNLQKDVYDAYRYQQWWRARQSAEMIFEFGSKKPYRRPEETGVDWGWTPICS